LAKIVARRYFLINQQDEDRLPNTSFKNLFMKITPGFIIIAITITCIYFPSCSKNSSSSSTTLPPPTCSNPSDCLINTWHLKQVLANYNGMTTTLSGNFDSQYMVFANNLWTEYSSPDTVFDTGAWKILPDSTVEISSTFPDTFNITYITPDTLKINIPFDHNYPSYPAVQVALVSGLDTAKLSAYLQTYTTTP
jgi:hypothetical protein